MVSLAFLALFPVNGFADREAPPQDFKVFSENKEYVFVNLIPSPELLGIKIPIIGIFSPIRMQYSQTGLYRNDGSKKPLWTLESGFGWNAEMFVSSDGKRLVVMGSWPRVWDDKDMEKDGVALRQPAIAFIAEGRVVKSYVIGDLAQNAKSFPITVSHFEWCKTSRYVEAEKRLYLETHDKQKLVFSTETGEIVERTKT